jgi:hypothetical protein
MVSSPENGLQVAMLTVCPEMPLTVIGTVDVVAGVHCHAPVMFGAMAWDNFGAPSERMNVVAIPG